MLQFYFLSVLLNIVIGFILVYASEKNVQRVDSSYDSSDSFLDELETERLEKEKEENFENSFLGNLFAPVFSLIKDNILKIVIGIVSIFVGFIKLFYTVQNDIALVGDFLPATAGIFGGAFIVLQHFDEKSEYGLTFPEFFENIFYNGKKYLGFFCIAAGVLHFIFPRVPIL